MEDSRVPRQAIQWELMGYKRKPGKNWMDIIRRNLKDVDTTWEGAEELATDVEQDDVNVWSLHLSGFGLN